MTFMFRSSGNVHEAQVLRYKLRHPVRPLRSCQTSGMEQVQRCCKRPAFSCIKIRPFRRAKDATRKVWANIHVARKPCTSSSGSPWVEHPRGCRVEASSAGSMQSPASTYVVYALRHQDE
jgi:hypothetical protein